MVTAQPQPKAAIADRLAEARRRTYALIEPLDEAQLNRVYSPLLSPLAWDLGHIANFEELWLVQTIGEREPLHGELGRFYDAIENPRRSRNELPLLRDAELRSYLADVRERALEVLDEVDIAADAEDPLLRDGFVYELLIAHEQQHNETMLQLLQMVEGYELPADFDAVSGSAGHLSPGQASGQLARRFEYPPVREMPGAAYEIGAPDDGFAYDNERPRHTVELGAFEIDSLPVTNGEYAQFVAEAGAEPPLYWERDGGRVGRHGDGAPRARRSRPAGHPRLLARGRRLRSLGRQAAAERARVGGGATRSSTRVGQVWEWTASDFLAYPGFEAFPYREYSEVFFGDEYKVLRGGSWATHRNLMRPSFRNWDLPQRRQIFCGFRCARDAR